MAEKSELIRICLGRTLLTDLISRLRQIELVASRLRSWARSVCGLLKPIMLEISHRQRRSMMAFSSKLSSWLVEPLAKLEVSAAKWKREMWFSIWLVWTIWLDSRRMKSQSLL